MPGIPTWKPEEIAFIRAASRAKHPEFSSEEIVAEFNTRFPKHQVTKSSVAYCISHYVDREEYNPKIWLASFPGKKGYLLGLSADGNFQHEEIIRRFEHRFPSHNWPGMDRTNENQNITKREAVEIAVSTYGEYAPLYGDTSLLDKYPCEGEATVQEVLEWHRQGYLPDVITYIKSPPLDYDDVIFILIRFASGFADSSM